MFVRSSPEGIMGRAATWLRGTTEPPRGSQESTVPHLHWDRASRRWLGVSATREEQNATVLMPRAPAGIA